MNIIQFGRVPRLGSPFSTPFDFNANVQPIGPLKPLVPNFDNLAPAGNGNGGNGAPAPAPDAGPADVDVVPDNALPPQMKPFYAFPVQEQAQPAAPPAPAGDGISTTTAVLIGAGALVAVAAIVALASRK